MKTIKHITYKEAYTLMKQSGWLIKERIYYIGKPYSLYHPDIAHQYQLRYDTAIKLLKTTKRSHATDLDIFYRFNRGEEE